MNNKSIVGALLILASAVLFSASLICSSLSAVATATLGFIATSKPSSITILQMFGSGKNSHYGPGKISQM